MSLKLVLAVGLLGIGIAFALYYSGILNPLIPTLDMIVAPISGLIPHVSGIIEHIKANYAQYAVFTGIIGTVITIAFNTLYKRAKEKTELAAQAQLNDAKAEMANIQQSTLSLTEENQDLKNRVLLYQQSNADKVELLDKIGQLQGQVQGLEMERNNLIEAKNAAWGVAREVKDTLEKSKQVP